MCYEISVYHSAILRRILNGTYGGRQGKRDVSKQRRGILLWLREFVFDFWHTVLPLFLKYTQFETNWYVTWSSMETFIFHSLARFQGGYAALRGTRFWANGSYIFLKVHKFSNRLIYNLVISGKPHFLTYEEPPSAILPRGSFSVDLKHMVLIFFLKVNKICNWLTYNMTIFGKFDFSHLGSPPGVLFCY